MIRRWDRICLVVVFTLCLAITSFASLPPTYAAVCGDNIVEAPEECDDGNLIDGDWCSSNCLHSITEQKRMSAGGASSYGFGQSVAISGNSAIVGASDSAYILHFNGTSWAQDSILLAADGNSGKDFGESVAISGDYAVVGAQYDSDLGPNSGAAYIFHNNGTAWVQQSKLTALDGAGYDYFGISVAISGDYAVIGSAGGDGALGDGIGSAYIFKFNGTLWVEQQKLTAEDGIALTGFGGSIAIFGDNIIIGAWASNDAYVFHFNGTSWVQQQKLSPADGAGGNGQFGFSVAISGDYAVIGARFDHDLGEQSGSAYIYHYNGSSWVQNQKLLASDGVEGDRFGISVALAGNYAFVGASGDSYNNSSSGSVYIYHYNGTSWAQETKLVASDGTDDDYFGHSVAITDSSAVVGAYGDDDMSGASGSVYFFSGTDIPCVDNDNDGFTTCQNDCNDGDNTIFPGTTEVCDLVDNNCNGLINEECVTTCGNSVTEWDEQCDDGNVNDYDSCSNTCISQTVVSTTCTDVDGDDFPIETDCLITGAPPEAVDCDDTDPLINMTAPEICDTIDNNCNTQIDEGAMITFCLDSDTDTYGDSTVSQDGCSPPVGYVANNTDCDDTDPLINPGQTEIIDNGIDDDCNPATTDTGTYYEYFPAIKDGPFPDGSWRNWLTIQAEDPSQPVTGTICLYDGDTGNEVCCGPYDIAINGRTPTTPNKACYGGGAGMDTIAFEGTVIVSADKPIQAMTNQLDARHEAYNAYEAPKPQASIFFPQSFDSIISGTSPGYQNIVHIMNINSTPVTIDVTYQQDPQGGGGIVEELNQVILPRAVYKRNVRVDVTGNLSTNPTETFNGTITAISQGGEPLLGMIRFEYILSDLSYSHSVYEATMTTTTAYYPWMNDNAGNLSNWYTALNPSNTNTVLCDFEYWLPGGGPTPEYTKQETVPPLGRVTRRPSAPIQYNAPFTGQMYMSCDGPVHAIMNVIQYDGTLVNADRYNNHEGTILRSVLFFPQVFDNIPTDPGYINYAHIFNPNPFDIDITVELFYSDLLVTEKISDDANPDCNLVVPAHGKVLIRPDTLNTVGTRYTNGNMLVTVLGGNLASGIMEFGYNQGSASKFTVYEAISP